MKKGKVKFYRDKDGLWRAKTIAANNRILVETSESYHNKQDAADALEQSAILIIKSLF
jgi:uncharacterized protein YegP (UPF0339 family)